MPADTPAPQTTPPDLELRLTRARAERDRLAESLLRVSSQLAALQGDPCARVRSNEDAAQEIAEEARRRFGAELRSPAALKWLASCIGEVRAEVADPAVPPHRIAHRWSKEASHG